MHNEGTPDKKDWGPCPGVGSNNLMHKLIKLRDSLDACIGCGCLAMQSGPIYNPEDALKMKALAPLF